MVEAAGKSLLCSVWSDLVDLAPGKTRHEKVSHAIEGEPGRVSEAGCEGRLVSRPVEHKHIAAARLRNVKITRRIKRQPIRRIQPGGVG